jgi:uncharacterized protein (DUF305 family)
VDDVMVAATEKPELGDEDEAPGEDPGDAVGDDGIAPGDPGGDADPGDDVDVDEWEPGGLSWPRVLVLGAALAFLGFALAVFLNRDQHPGDGSVDVGFLRDMASHHEQALEMAQLELVNGSDPGALAFAREILIFQSKEIGSMERLLSTWDTGRGNPDREAMAWMGMASPVEAMPGMATEEELDALRDARGTDADALFFELMARHHVGGIHMAEYAAENAGTSDVRNFAAIVGRNQAIEVNEFAQTVERLGLPVEIERVEVPLAPGA